MFKETISHVNTIFGNESKWISFNKDLRELAFCVKGEDRISFYICNTDKKADYKAACKELDGFTKDSFESWYNSRGLTISGYSE